MKKETVAFNLNGEQVTAEVLATWNLLRTLREVFELTGAKQGCGEGECGACTVMVDGLAVNSCLFPIMEIEGKTVVTIEGLAAADGTLHPIQQAFIDNNGVQCGYCTSGMIMSAKALLDRQAEPSEEEIRTAISGNICRCTGYVQIVEAIQMAAKMMKQEPTFSPMKD
jgi:aerobic-type carbon monoxide dehydrogenase small subunit (CoxS/CutS family)